MSKTKKDKLTMSIKEVAERLGISRNLAYTAAKAKQFPTIAIGRRLVVPCAAFDRWLANVESSPTVPLRPIESLPAKRP